MDISFKAVRSPTFLFTISTTTSKMATAVLRPSAVPNPAAQPLPETLRANNGYVEQAKLGWLRPTTLDTPVEEMRRRLDQDDYLFVKGVIPREDVLAMREHYFSQFKDTGLLKPGASAVDGIYNDAEDSALHRGIGGGDPMGEDLSVLVEAHTKPFYRSFVAHPRLRAKVRELMGWDEEVLLQRTMLRHNVPGGGSTGVHYDKLFLRGGDAFFLTAWVPIGDIRCDGGGLIYLENSVRLGQAIEDDFNERAKDLKPEEKISAFNQNMTSIGILSDNPEEFQTDHQRVAEKAGMGGRDYRWLISNYEAGDVVFHHPCSIHASCSNRDPEGRIRLSTDLRFYDKKDHDEGTADERWMKYWTMGDGL